MSSGPQIIIFDGVCNFCHGAVNFIIKRDKDEKFCFVTMQSESGKKLASEYQIDNFGIDTIVLIKQSKTYTLSDAALEITNELDSPWPLLYSFRILPRGIRDWIYSLFARHRYRWFGQMAVCPVPPAHLKNRFLDSHNID